MLEVLDTAGQEEYTALRDQWIRDGEGFVLVYSISSRASFTRIKQFHHQIQRVKESAALGSPTYPGSPISAASIPVPSGPAPVMLVGNKCDRVTEREVSVQEGSALAKELRCDFVEASAKNCTNVEKAFYDVVRQLRRQRANGPASRGGAGGNNHNHHHQLAGGLPEASIYTSRTLRPARGGYGMNEKEGDRKRYRREKKSSKCVIL